MQLLFFLLLAGNLLLTAATLWKVSRCAPSQSRPPSSSDSPDKEERLDPVDEGFENIMRFTVRTHQTGGEFP